MTCSHCGSTAEVAKETKRRAKARRRINRKLGVIKRMIRAAMEDPEYFIEKVGDVQGGLWDWQDNAGLELRS